MRNYKSVLLVLLTILIVAGLGRLPELAAAWQDSRGAAPSGRAQMQGILLEPEEADTSIMGKLAMLSRMETISVDSTEMSSRTMEEMLSIAQTQMADYEQAGIFQWFSVEQCWAQLNLGIDTADVTNYLLYWTVFFTGGEGDYSSLLLDIDDETGKILNIRYDVYDREGTGDDNEALMTGLTDVYFSQLGLTEAAAYAQSSGAGYSYYDWDNGVSKAQYSFGDALYGQINMEFCVESNGGFFITFSNS